jgi:methanogen homoaconitase large subunit
MAQTIVEQILSHAVGRPVTRGDLVTVRPDVIMAHDSLAPSVISILHNRLGLRHVANPDQCVLVMDHVAPASTVGTANNQNLVRAFAREEGIRLFEVGRGICHQVLVEEGIAKPGAIVVGSDSHSTSYGAVGAFGTGMGSTDIALAMGTGKVWFKVPETLQVQASGRFSQGVEAKDLALYLARQLGVDGATYMAIEYLGLDWLPLNGRQTLASMAIELGAKAGIFPPTGIIAERFPAPAWLEFDPHTVAAKRIEVELSVLEPQIALPHSVDQVVDLSAIAGQQIDVIFLGTCTNGRYEDMRQVADILRGRQIAADTRLIVTPASRQELQRAITDDTMSVLLDAGATLTTPGCGPCMGRHQGTLGQDDICLSTGNRNFRGRMGHPTSQIFLASPSVAAASAIMGHISDPRDL